MADSKTKPERCPQGHPLVPLSISVFACIATNSSSVANVWELTSQGLESPPSYYAVLAMAQGYVDNLRGQNQ